MTINERVKIFRKDILCMSQREFADKLGMKQTGISYMERIGSTVTDSNIKSICLIFNLNEEWLRYGTEPMYIEPETFNLDEFIKKYNASQLELEIIKTYFELDPAIRQAIIAHFKEKLSISSTISTPVEEENDYYSEALKIADQLDDMVVPLNRKKDNTI